MPWNHYIDKAMPGLTSLTTCSGLAGGKGMGGYGGLPQASRYGLDYTLLADYGVSKNIMQSDYHGLHMSHVTCISMYMYMCMCTHIHTLHIKVMLDRNLSQAGFHLRRGAQGKLLPQSAQLPPLKFAFGKVKLQSSLIPSPSFWHRKVDEKSFFLYAIWGRG